MHKPLSRTAIFFVRVITAVVVVIASELSRDAAFIFALEIAAAALFEHYNEGHADVLQLIAMHLRIRTACLWLVAAVGTVSTAVAHPRLLNALRAVAATELILEARRVIGRAAVLLVREIATVVIAVASLRLLEALSVVGAREDRSVKGVATDVARRCK